MANENNIFIFLGALFIFAALGLAFVKVKPDDPEKIATVFPGATLFRFMWFRLGLAVVCALLGAFCIYLAIGVK